MAKKKTRRKTGQKPARKSVVRGRRDSAAPEKRGSLVAQAYEEIKEKIITLYFLPGQYLNESALSSLLGLGRTPVHQALQRLQVDGLVEIMPRKGVIVMPDGIAEILKILDSRTTVEAELARNAAERASPEEARELQALAKAPSSGKGDPNIDLFIGGDRAFHSRLAQLSGNPVLSDFARRLHERSIRYWYLHLWQTIDPDGTSRQHSAIADAIARHDGAGAEQTMRDHIASLKSRLMQVQTRRHGEQERPKRRAADRSLNGDDTRRPNRP